MPAPGSGLLDVKRPTRESVAAQWTRPAVRNHETGLAQNRGTSIFRALLFAYGEVGVALRESLFRHPPVAFLNSSLRLFQAACGLGGLRSPVFPAGAILLEQGDGPSVVAVGEKHAAI